MQKNNIKFQIEEQREILRSKPSEMDQLIIKLKDTLESNNNNHSDELSHNDCIESNSNNHSNELSQKDTLESNDNSHSDELSHNDCIESNSNNHSNELSQKDTLESNDNNHSNELSHNDCIENNDNNASINTLELEKSFPLKPFVAEGLRDSDSDKDNNVSIKSWVDGDDLFFLDDVNLNQSASIKSSVEIYHTGVFDKMLCRYILDRKCMPTIILTSKEYLAAYVIDGFPGIEVILESYHPIVELI